MEAPPFSYLSSSSQALTFRSSSCFSLLRLRFNLPKNHLKFKYYRNVSVRASSAGPGTSVVTLLDYGAGNVHSIRNAIRHIGFDIKDVQSPEDITNADRLVFPGVGAFAAAMDFIKNNGMAEALCNYIKDDRPFLGICL